MMIRLSPFLLLVFTIVCGATTPLFSNSWRLEQDGSQYDNNENGSANNKNVEDEEDKASDTTRDDAASRSERSDEIWNAQHCQIKGCKVVTPTMINIMQSHIGANDNLINRNLMVDPLYHLPVDMKPLPLTRNVDYLGVLLDAGRNYYHIDWIHNLLQVMHAMGYNLLHFRLTDDQAFNVRLDSMPALANPPLLDAKGRVYTALELKELVAYANVLDIVIMPEVNLPGHAAAWAGNHTPNLVVACPEYTCGRAYGVPLNLKHPKLLSIVKTVLKEVLSIFSTSPFLHLGGDELQVANQCLEEANYTDFDSDHERFEKELHNMLEEDLRFSATKVIRWEAARFEKEEEIMFVGTREVKRAGEIVHYWFTKEYKEWTSETPSPYFCSEGLYFDTNEKASAWDVFGMTRRMIAEPKPRAIIAGTFELSTSQWMDRNVVGRLIAVAMGVSDQSWNSDTFTDSYGEMCRDLLHFDEGLCASEGVPLLDEILFRVDQTDMQSAFQESLCQKLTTRELRRQLKFQSWAKHRIYGDAMANFWVHFGEDPPEFASSLLEASIPALNETLQSLDFLRDNQPEVQYRGISLDLVQIDFDLKSMGRIIATLDLMHHLGYNMLQLCIMNDLGFAVAIPKHPNLAWGDSARFTKTAIWKIVSHAESLGIHVIPEFTTATRAGGWFSAGILANCPAIMCDRGVGVGANATDAALLGITISLMHQLLELFHHPPYLHLGYDEREEVQACYEEANLEVDLDNFERRLIDALNFQDFNVSKLIRWENEEGVLYPTRAGEITHYRSKLPTEKTGNSFFISTGLNFGDPDFSNVTAWGMFERTRELLKHRPTGILATVDLVHEAFWKDFSILRRLVAFSMGLSSSNWTSEVDFQKSLNSILSILEVEEDLKGDVPGDANISQGHLAKHRLLRRQSACSRRTLKVWVELPKEGIFAQAKGNGTILR